jgi:dUTP pyrophosphatase
MNNQLPRTALTNGYFMKVKILDRRLEAFGMPGRSTPGSAGIDLRAMNCGGFKIDEQLYIWPMERQLIGTGIAVEVLPGYAGLVYPRSSMAHKKGLIVGNCVGVIDSDFRGEVMVSLWNTKDGPPAEITPGMRIAQLVIQRVEVWPLFFVDELSRTERGAGGFGSSGHG